MLVVEAAHFVAMFSWPLGLPLEPLVEVICQHQSCAHWPKASLSQAIFLSVLFWQQQLYLVMLLLSGYSRIVFDCHSQERQMLMARQSEPENCC